ncbi:hypothetical protein L1987_54534 [Smallanthus sonchifolius]|uniref:Uncharacterized protein n=1 Tax=Smallanthus sonchifolius TaxID=185202 RepID=A0ACB9E751_9ASTR|nr:hypothetical protein L1987_54534 [Smallanthus sonchifolius]
MCIQGKAGNEAKTYANAKIDFNVDFTHRLCAAMMDNMVAGSSAKIVDCVLGLKEYNDRKRKKKGNETFKHDFRSPLIMHPRSEMIQMKTNEVQSTTPTPPVTRRSLRGFSHRTGQEDFHLKELTPVLMETGMRGRHHPSTVLSKRSRCKHEFDFEKPSFHGFGSKRMALLSYNCCLAD